MSAQEPAWATGPNATTRRAAFATSVAQHGLALSAAEAESVYQLAAWISESIERLPDAEPVSSASDVLDVSFIEQGRRMREGRLTSIALVEAHLERIARRDPSYRAFYTVDAAGALAAAARADAELASGQDRGPLHGIAIGIKDLIDVAGLPTTADAPGRASAIADNNAAVVDRLVAGGAIILGKLATYEWGTVGPDNGGLFPPARNPWSLEHITGGSSSGGGAAVAGGLLRTTIGTDTGGSLRGPAFYCGVVGLKPTFGSVPTGGVLAMAPSMDHIGPMSATVAEAAVTLDVIAGLAGATSATRLLGQPIAGRRIGYARNWFAQDSQTMPAVLAAMDAALSTLSELGAAIAEVELPDYDVIEVAAAAILHRESFEYHAADLRERPEAYGRRAFLSLATGLAITDAELAAARRAGERFHAAIDLVLERCDAIVTVGALTTALPAAPFETEAVWTPMRTIGFNVSGHPVLAVPIGFHAGLPIGMQIVGRQHDEAGIVQLGDAFEHATDHAIQRPRAVG
ncbi:amidase [uncultured Devosia sp.]|uniref:amidase n=1 Tax=uncultured Devosia sp. TaxID=211434 RepID=UPI0035CC21FE